jgi:hypothetical protein
VLLVNKTISNMEFDGVEVAAVVALDQRTSEQKEKIKALKTENGELRTRLERLEQRIGSYALAVKAE